VDKLAVGGGFTRLAFHLSANGIIVLLTLVALRVYAQGKRQRQQPAEESPA
jgi:hypothetical protein